MAETIRWSAPRSVTSRAKDSTALVFSGPWLLRCAVLALTASFVCATIPGAHAFELFGFRLWGKPAVEDSAVIADPQNYTIDVVVLGAEDETTLRNASSLWQARNTPASGTSGLLATAKGDYRRILSALYANGHYGGVITITIDGRDPSDIASDADLPDTVPVNVTIEAGPLFAFNQARIMNQAPDAVERRDRVDLPESAGFAPGETARAGAIRSAGSLAVEAWRQQGHPLARVSDRDIVADHNDNTLDATVTVDPGPKAVFGPVSVEGTDRMNPAFVARQTGLTPGEEYDPDEIERANKRLARLEVFRAARIREAESLDAGTLPILVNVEERKPRRIGIGATASTLDGLGIEAFWLHRNLFGQAERFRLDARVGGLGSTIMPDEFDYRAAATFTKPGVLTPDTDLVASVFGEREVLELYTETSAGARLGFTHIVNDEIVAELAFFGTRSRFEDDLGTRQFTTVGADATLTYDGRDDPADATRGFYLKAMLTPFHEFEFGNTAVAGTVEGRVYRSFAAADRFTIAVRAKVGTVAGAPIDEIPLNRLFFAGGGGSVRGYAYQNIGVDVDNGNVTGGRSLIEGSFELRTRFNRSFGGVVFADAGYVSDSTLPDFNEDLRIGVGAGVRYYTGLGPIRLDVAVPLNRQDGDPPVAFYVGLGQAF